MSELVEAEVAFGDTKITIRGPREFVQAEVTRLAGLSRDSSSPGRRSRGEEADGLLGAANEREFVAAKGPKGHHEMATVLAFWLTNSDGAIEFTEDDIRRAYIRAAVRPPKVVGQALRDAKRTLDSIGQGSKRGTYKLTTYGDRLVRFDMPRR